MIGRTIGQYQVIDKIGEGGMGAVYKAEDTSLHRLVALKALSRSLSEDPEAQERFVREAQAASALNHPNITTVFELVQDSEDDSQLICMEYVEGKTIRDMVETGRVSVRKAIDIIMQAAEALEAAHTKGILHRDVKSANIMVSMEGRVKVMDFGLAHLETRSQLTRTGTTMGTLSYSSPEQISGRPVDARSEIFSLGVVFYELLTGRLPFSATNEAELIFSIINNEPDRLTIVRDDVPELVEAVSKKMLEKDPELRYRNCGEVITDLKGIRKEMETSTVSISTPEDIRPKRYLINRKVVLFGVPIGALLIVLGYLILPHAYPPPEQVMVAIFENRTGDESLDPFCQQISEAIAEKNDGIDFITARSATSLSESALSRIRQKARPQVALGRRTDSGTVVTGAIYLTDAGAVQIQSDITVLEDTDRIPPPDPLSGARDRLSTMVDEWSDRLAARIAAALNPGLMEWLAGASPPPSLAAYRLLNQSGELFIQRRYDECIAVLLRIAGDHPDYLIPRIQAALAYSNNGQYAESDSMITTLLPHRSDLTLFEQAYLDWLSGLKDGNLHRMYEAVTLMAAENRAFLFQAGYDAIRINRPNEALNYLRQVPETSKVYQEWYSYWQRRIDASYMLRDYRRQLRTARKARELFPQSWGFFREEVTALAALGRMKELRELLDQSYAFPGTGTGSAGGTIRNAGIELHVQGRHDDAAALFDESLRWYESQPARERERLHSSIAETHYWAGNADEARRLYLQLHDEDPQNVTYLTYLGCLAGFADEVDEAHRYIEELGALEVTPRHRGVIIGCQAGIAASVGERERAMTLLQEAFQHGYPFGPLLHYLRYFDPIRDYPPFQEWIRPKG